MLHFESIIRHASYYIPVTKYICVLNGAFQPSSILNIKWSRPIFTASLPHQNYARHTTYRLRIHTVAHGQSITKPMTEGFQSNWQARSRKVFPHLLHPSRVFINSPFRTIFPFSKDLDFRKVRNKRERPLSSSQSVWSAHFGEMCALGLWHREDAGEDARLSDHGNHGIHEITVSANTLH